MQITDRIRTPDQRFRISTHYYRETRKSTSFTLPLSHTHTHLLAVDLSVGEALLLECCSHSTDGLGELDGKRPQLLRLQFVIENV